MLPKNNKNLKLFRKTIMTMELLLKLTMIDRMEEWLIGHLPIINRWMHDYWKISFYFIIAYLIAIIAIGKIMKTRERLRLRWSLFAWNAVLSVFSFVGLYRLFPFMLQQYKYLVKLLNFVCSHLLM